MRCIWILAVVVLLLPFPLFATTWTVKPDGTGDFPTIQAAVNASTNGDEIVLTDGTFTGVGNREVDFLGKEIVIRSQNGAAATTINCGGQNGFFFTSSETDLSQLRNVTITSANLAVACNPGSPLISGCSITACSFGISAGVNDFQNPPSSSPQVDLCTISGCGLAMETRHGGSILLTNSTISSSTFNGYSGIAGGFITASNCSFVSNFVAASWSPGYIAGGTFTNCTFTGQQNAAIRTRGANVAITDCHFEANHPAIHCRVEGAVVTGCTFVNNSSINGGAILAENGSFGILRIFDSVFCQNSASAAGGAVYSELQIEISRNTFARNSSASGAGAIHLVGAYATGPVVRNILAFSTQGPGISCVSTASPTLTCNDVFGNVGGNTICGVNGGNNISLDPSFCAGDCSDLGLAQSSPCTAANSPCGQQLGAEGINCIPTPVDNSSRAPVFLAAPVPNPVTGSSRLDFTMEKDGPVSIVVYDVAGRRVTTLFEGHRPKGRHSVDLDSGKLTSGLYFIKLQTSATSLSRKFVVAH